MEISEPFLALGKLALAFILIFGLLRLRAPLWLAIASGAVLVAISCGIALVDWPGIVFAVVRQQDFLVVSLMVFLICLFSSVQESTGQSRLLVKGLEQHLHWPRLRLVLFPALIGLLPMPGGALFSCPMIKDAASEMGVSEQKKALINFWFRHIWEMAWPLYPGYVLASSLLGIPLSRICLYTFPLPLLAFAVGWFFLMRDVRPEVMKARAAACQQPDDAAQEPGGDAPIPSLAEVLLHSLPIAVTLIGALFFSLLFDIFLQGVPGTLSFSFALICAIGTALWQGRKRKERFRPGMVFTPNTRKIMVLLFVIFIFKQTIETSGLLQSLADIADNTRMVIFSFFLLPFIGGMLTGMMVGYVGVSFPILLGILAHSPLQEYTLPLVLLGLISGNAGQMISPLHVCLVVTSEYFTTPASGMLRRLFMPVLVMFAASMLLVLIVLTLGMQL